MTKPTSPYFPDPQISLRKHTSTKALLTLYDFRKAINPLKIRINEATATTGHKKGSVHYTDFGEKQGCAFDCVIYEKSTGDLSWKMQYLIAEWSNLWSAIGGYPIWNTSGLHLDTRQDTNQRWIRIGKDYWNFFWTDGMFHEKKEGNYTGRVIGFESAPSSGGVEI